VRLRRAACAALIVGGCLVAFTRTAAHDLERTRVSLAFEADGTFALDIANDPEWLLLRLEPFLEDYPDIPARATSDRLAPRDRDERLTVLAPVMRDRIVLFVDGREVQPGTVTYLAPAAPTEPDGAPMAGHYRLQGRVSPDARLLRWFYGIVADPYPLTISRADGQTYTEWIGGTVWSRPIDLTGQFTPPTRWEIVREYVVLGFTHILPKGLDHILFVLGLFLLSSRVKPVLWQVTAFTVAHSITLGLSMYGVVALPPFVVEPLIALSIAYVAVENLVTRELRAWRVLVVFLFGLLHGLGFAGVLRELGLPRSQFLTALLSFNVGVEIGQLAVIAAAALALWPALRRTWYRPRVAVPLSIAIAAIGVYWTILRVVAR
jgi:HupE / UreJ protein